MTSPSMNEPPIDYEYNSQGSYQSYPIPEAPGSYSLIPARIVVATPPPDAYQCDYSSKPYDLSEPSTCGSTCVLI